jgi:predicted aspartyl protease
MTDSVITFPYDRQRYSPPAPIMLIEIDAPGRARSNRTVTALIDSGADATLLPIDMLQEISARAVGYATLVGISDKPHLAEVYIVNILVGPYTLYAVRVLAMPAGSDSVVGRDVLNHLTITLNGPAGAVELVQ